MTEQLDLFVIGGGSGGVRAARIAAGHGARVALAEEYRYGGTCVIRGCVPKKLLVLASRFADQFERAADFGWTSGTPRFDWATLRSAKDRELARLEGLYRDGLERAGVRTIDSRAVLEGPHTVRIIASGEKLRARHVLIATGGTPVRNDIPGAALAITSNEIFDLPALPAHAVIEGGGYIAIEFACLLQRLGVKVTLVYRGELILRQFDDDLRRHLDAAMRADGIEILTGEALASIVRSAGGLRVSTAGGVRIDTGMVLLATGRRPNVDGLGLAAAGVEVDAMAPSACRRTRAPASPACGRWATSPTAWRSPRWRSGKATPSPTRCLATSRGCAITATCPRRCFPRPRSAPSA